MSVVELVITYLCGDMKRNKLFESRRKHISNEIHEYVSFLFKILDKKGGQQ